MRVTRRRPCADAACLTPQAAGPEQRLSHAAGRPLKVYTRPRAGLL